MSDPVAQRPAMDDYGVEAATWEPLPWSWARERLTSARNYWLCTVSGAGRPHSMPVWGVWHDLELRFAFGCVPTARKARNLAANPRLVITSEDTVECLSVEGTATLIDDDRKEVWIERTLDKYRSVVPDLGAPFLRRNLMFEVTPERAFAVIDRDDEFSTRPTRWVGFD